MGILYDCLAMLGALGFSPKILWDRFVKKKAGPTLAQRLGLTIPNPQGKSVIWIHGVSVGEIKAAEPLFSRLKEQRPDTFFLITCTTKTGEREAQRSLAAADAIAFLPLDLSWIMRRWAKALRPSHFFLIEGDFWYNQLRALKRQQTKLILVSGKISELSSSRLRKCSFFARRLFGCFDLFCLQSEEMAQRFAPFFPMRSFQITGNIKLDAKPQPLPPTFPTLDLYPKEKITLASTHPREEEILLDALRPLFSQLTIFLAPRHLERLETIKKTLEKRAISYICWSRLSEATGQETVILLDTMGQLPLCYTRSLLTFVGGSFVDRVGGHNILEPCLYGCPAFFGPYAYAQKALSIPVLEAGAGLQLPCEPDLEQLFNDREKLTEMRCAASHLAQQSGAVTEKTFFFMREKNIWK